MDFEIIRQLLTALALGTLIGLERERSEREEKKFSFAGIRTFALMGLFGVVATIISEGAPILFWILTGGFLLFLIAAYVTNSLMTKTIGATTEFAALFVYFIGVLCAQNEYTLATILRLILLAILHFKTPLHTFAAGVNKEELTSTVKFMIIAFVILPLLPNQTYGTYDVLNPYVIWLMVVFISGMSFISYIAIRLVGPHRGIGLTGFLGGLISSTALTMSFSGQSKKNPSVVRPYVFAVVIASSAMFFRILVEVFVLNRELFNALIIPLGVMGGVGLLCAYYIFTQNNSRHLEQKEIKSSTLALKSPFQLKPALQFGLIFGFILFFSKSAQAFFGNEGVYLTSVFGGLMEVDAITVTMANLSKSNSIGISTGALAVSIAAIINTLTKGLIFLLFGNRAAALGIAKIFAIMVFSGIVALAAIVGI